MKQLLNVLKYLLLLGISGLLMWYALHTLDFSRLGQEIRSANLQWVALSILVSLPGYFSRAWRWRMQLTAAKTPAPFWPVYHALMVGYLANIVLPRAGEVARCTVLNRTAGVPVKVAFGTVITERVIDLLMLLSLLGLLLILEFKQLQSFFALQFNERFQAIENNQQLLLIIGVTILVLGILGLVLLIRNLQKLREKALYQRVAGFVRGMLAGVLSVTRVRNQGAFWFHTVFIWATYYFTAFVLLEAMPATQELGARTALALLVIGGFGMAAPVQGGIGVFHLMVRATLIAYGLSGEEGMAYALLSHTTQTVLTVLMGCISFVASMAATARRKRKLALGNA